MGEMAIDGQAGVDVERFYVVPWYALDGSQGVQLREVRGGRTTYGWLRAAAPTAADPTEVWRTLDAGPWVTVGHGDVFDVARQLGYSLLEGSR